MQKPEITTEEPPVNDRQLTLANFCYNLIVLFGYFVSHIFFREVEVIGIENVPKKGPALLVCAPHANQFVDGAVVFTPVKLLRGRNTSSIIAESSYKQTLIGFLARMANAIPVPRAQDNLKPARGKIFLNKQDVGSSELSGENTDFTQFEAGGLIGLPQKLGNYKIKEIIDETHLVLAKPISSEKAVKLLTSGEPQGFTYCKKLDTHVTFQSVFNLFYRQGIIAIFPEGGSHDRTDLLPFKPGVAIMALGSIAAITAKNPEATLQVVPTGLYYFHRHRFRSRAVLEFGEPITVGKKDGEAYLEDPQQAVLVLLERIKESIKAVTINAPDRETLLTIQAARRLYQSPANRPMDLATVNEMTRRLLIGYNNYKGNEKIQSLFEKVSAYDKELYKMGLKDHHVKNKILKKSKINALEVLLQRLAKVIIFGTLSLPGILLFFPVFLAVHFYSKKKQRLALAKSSVKIEAKDVVATWKVLVATIFAPILYVFYSVVGVKLVRYYELGIIRNSVVLFVGWYLIFVFTTYSAYRIGEAGMDLVKSLPPLFLQILSTKSLKKLQDYREVLSAEVTDAINELGPALFPDFDSFYQEGASTLKKSVSVSSLSNIAFFSQDSDDELQESTDSDNDLGSSYEHVDSLQVGGYQNELRHRKV